MEKYFMEKQAMDVGERGSALQRQLIRQEIATVCTVCTVGNSSLHGCAAAKKGVVDSVAVWYRLKSESPSARSIDHAGEGSARRW